MASGETRVLRFDSDYVYVSHVRGNDRAGELSHSELKKTQTGYSDKTRRRAGSYDAATFCTFEQQSEFTAVSAGRIEGWTMVPPEGGKFDWRKCTYSDAWKKFTFTWIPSGN